MSHVIANFIQNVDKARKSLNKVRGTQLQSQGEREHLRSLVEEYFSSIRSTVVSEEEQDNAVKSIDDDMQELLSMCHKRGSVRSYQQLLGKIKAELISLDALSVSFSAPSGTGKIDNADAEIIRTLQSMLPSAALSYQQAISDLQQAKRLSWRGPATDLRECLRETLDHLAPDEEVKSVSGYKQDPNTTGPTMKQKVRFVLKSRGESSAVSAPAEAAADAVEEAVGNFVRAIYSRSNVCTHTPTDKSEVLRVRDLVRVALCELLEIHVSN